MISRVLVPIDDSEMSQRALAYTLENHSDAEITVLHVVGEPSPMWGAPSGLALEDDFEAAVQERAEEVFAPARELAAEHGVELETAVEVGNVAKAIVNTADEFDLVVIGSHSGGLADRLFVGNNAENIVRHSPAPVTVVR